MRDDNDRLPRDPLKPTIPAPADEDPMGLMRELRAALENAGELMTRLSTKLACMQMAMLTEEAQTIRVNERVDEVARDVRKIIERLDSLEAAE